MLRVYGWFLTLLPRDLRDEYGDEMLDVIRAQHAERVGGSGGAAGFWAKQLWAVVRAAASLRWGRGLRHRGHDSHGRARNTGGGGGMDGLAHDVRQAVRSLWKKPGFTAVTALTLGLGIGASTAIFSAVHAVLFRALPYEDADRIVVLFHEDTRTAERSSGFSPANARDLAENSDLLTHVAVAEPWSVDLEVDGRPETMRAWAVSEGFFEALGTEPILGRTFVPEEHVDYQPVVVLGHRSWQRRFGGDPSIVGKTFTAADTEVTVIGVLGPRFKLPDEAELWLPRTARESDDQERSADYMMGVGRLRPGATVEQAEAEVARVASSLAEAYPESNATTTFRAVPLQEYLFGDVRTPLLVLLSAVGLVLLIACANVAGLMLARGAQRRREYALRGALGASSGRLMRQITLESVLLAAMGCLFGVALTYGGVAAITRIGPDHLPRIDELSVDGAVLVFAVVMAGLSAFLAGVTPSMRLSRTSLSLALTDGSRSSTLGRDGLRTRNRLVVAEVAAAVVLLVGAGLLSRSFTTLVSEDLGFDPTDRLAVQIFAYDEYDGPEDRNAFVRQAIENMEAIPGVERVALASTIPAATDAELASIDIDLRFTITGREVPPVGQEPIASISQVSPGFFDVVGMPIVEGRGFDENDRSDGAMVVVINETLARRHFGDASPVGEEIVIGFRPIPRQIVGVVGDVRPTGYESEPRPEVYFPLAQFGTGSLTFVLKGTVDAGTLLMPAMEAIWEANPAQPIWGSATMESLLASWLTERSFNLLLMVSLAAIALALSGVGIYALISFSVQQRVAEMGIRRALGGGAGSILSMVLAEGMKLAVLGLALGCVLAYPLTRFIQGMLHGVEATDPWVLAGLVLAVMCVAGLATLLPGLKAVRADPMRALRTE